MLAVMVLAKRLFVISCVVLFLVFIRESLKEKLFLKISRWILLILAVLGLFTQITFVKYSVYDEIGYCLENLSVPREEANNKIEQVIELLNLQKIRNQNPYDLSGGQKQMVALASVIVLDPELIILDEPTSQLDPSSTLAVYDIVKNLKEQGKTIIIVDHKVDLLAQICDEIDVIQDGQLALKGETHHVFSDKKVIEAGGQLPEVSDFYLQVHPEAKKVPFTFD